MIKLLRKYYLLNSKDDKVPDIRSKIELLRKDFEKYFDTTPVGTVYPWAGGTIKRNNNDSTYTDSKGKELNLNKNSNILWLYSHPDIKKQWDSAYNKKDLPFIREPVILGNVVNNNVKMVSTVKNTTYVDASPCEYVDWIQQYIQTMEWLAMEIALHFPNRPAGKLTYLDASSRTGVCPNHSTHNSNPPSCLDIQYFTKGETNYTQGGYPRTNIWTNNHILDKNIFDAERMAMLVVLMAEAFPALTNTNSCQIIAWPDIKQAMMDVYSVNSQKYNIIEKIVQADSTPSYNHDRHMHVSLVGEVNYEMIV